MTLGDYLLWCATQRRRAGVHDCCTLPAGWVIERGHRDPMARWRGRYTSDAQAEDMVFRGGSLLELFREALAGLPQPRDPEAGDVAVVDLHGEQAGSLFTGTRWAFIGTDHMVFLPVERVHILAMWRP